MKEVVEFSAQKKIHFLDHGALRHGRLYRWTENSFLLELLDLGLTSEIIYPISDPDGQKQVMLFFRENWST